MFLAISYQQVNIQLYLYTVKMKEMFIACA
jgi:hypothetical protein